jgi:hypothetical protein
MKIFSRILKYCRDINQVLKRTAIASKSKKKKSNDKIFNGKIEPTTPNRDEQMR